MKKRNINNEYYGLGNYSILIYPEYINYNAYNENLKILTLFFVFKKEEKKEPFAIINIKQDQKKKITSVYIINNIKYKKNIENKIKKETLNIFIETYFKRKTTKENQIKRYRIKYLNEILKDLKQAKFEILKTDIKDIKQKQL